MPTKGPFEYINYGCGGVWHTLINPIQDSQIGWGFLHKTLCGRAIYPYLKKQDAPKKGQHCRTCRKKEGLS